MSSNDYRNMRDLAALTQTRTARAAGIDRSRLSQFECGEIQLTAAEVARLRTVLRQGLAERRKRVSVALESV